MGVEQQCYEAGYRERGEREERREGDVFERQYFTGAP